LNKLRRHKVFDASDVNYRALNKSFRQPVWIRIQPDLDGVPLDESSVMVGDVECSSVRQAKSERLKWLTVHAAFDLLRVKHTLNLLCF
jgi:hypothetical protein